METPAIDRVLTILRERFHIDNISQLHNDKKLSDYDANVSKESKESDFQPVSILRLIEERTSHVVIEKRNNARNAAVLVLVRVLQKIYQQFIKHYIIRRLRRYVKWKKEFRQSAKSNCIKLNDYGRYSERFSVSRITLCIQRLGKTCIADNYRKWSVKRNVFSKWLDSISC